LTWTTNNEFEIPRLNFSISANHEVTRNSLKLNKCNIVDALKNDREFLADDLTKADSACQKKIQQSKCISGNVKSTLHRHFMPLLTSFLPICNQVVLMSRMLQAVLKISKRAY